ncbi:MAG: glutathione S-transferase C-terminal domain-containing protein [Pseudomonadales bacterium]|nr:glutathione S-transferase C-terminal domain-containing protein [Pseudomonadales bacterium]
MKTPWVIYGSELSPFTLKIIAIFQQREIPFQFMFTEGSRWENIKIELRKQALVKGLLPLTWPIMDEDDEFPLVPYVFNNKGENFYDSSAIAQWIEQQQLGNDKDSLYCPENLALDFIIRLVDEYADDYGLYMAHHHRWKVSATDNNAGARLAHELRSLAQPMRDRIAKNFSERQVSRLPYLFSVAPKGFLIENLPESLQPPSHNDFPPTHDLLEDSFKRLLAACENILQQQPYLFGQRFTLADASIYGQLAMNLKDTSAANLIQSLAPTTYQWLLDIHEGDFQSITKGNKGNLTLSERHKLLLAEICRTYVPLMQQNLNAFNQYQSQGQSYFNEKAFDQNKAIYSGIIDGTPFKHVAKSFQAKTWRALLSRWNALSTQEKLSINSLMPESHGLDKDTQNG